MKEFLLIIFILVAVFFFLLFIRRYKANPLWLMLSVWMMALGVPQLHLSKLEKNWPVNFWLLIGVSLASFALGFLVFNKLWQKYPFWSSWSFLTHVFLNIKYLRAVIYFLVLFSIVALYMFYIRAGNFPLLAPDSDVFRFTADEKVPGLINYCAQFARIFIPLAFFIMFWEKFSFRKHWDLVVLCLFGAVVLTLFASRTQIFFIDLWVMALYLFIRKPNLRQALKFYPIFLLISVMVLSSVPLIRQYKSYGSSSYLAGVTEIDSSHFNPVSKFLLPIYVGVSFNMQALLHAQQYYSINPVQQGRVTLDPFTNIFSKVTPSLNQYKSHYDLGQIFLPWWNTGTYLFPFVQDFGTAAFYFVPFLIAGILALVWQYWKSSSNFLSMNLYSYACFFIVMSIYLSFTVRAEMYIDLFLLVLFYWLVTTKSNKQIIT